MGYVAFCPWHSSMKCDSLLIISTMCNALHKSINTCDRVCYNYVVAGFGRCETFKWRISYGNKLCCELAAVAMCFNVITDLLLHYYRALKTCWSNDWWNGVRLEQTPYSSCTIQLLDTTLLNTSYSSQNALMWYKILMCTAFKYIPHAYESDGNAVIFYGLFDTACCFFQTDALLQDLEATIPQPNSQTPTSPVIAEKSVRRIANCLNSNHFCCLVREYERIKYIITAAIVFLSTIPY